MRRIQFTFALATVVMALAVILEAQQWVSGTASITTSGSVSITDDGADALSVTGGADIGGVIQAGSENVNLTNSSGNILETAIADGSVLARVADNETITGSWTFGTTQSILAPAGSIALQIIGRAADNTGRIYFYDNAGTTPIGYIGYTGSGTLQIGPVAGAGITTNVPFTNAGRYNSAAAQPGFLAYNSADDSGQGNGATVDVDTEVFDNTSSFASDTFTAPVTGQYHFCAGALIGTAAARVTLNLVTTGATYGLAKDQHASEATLLSGCIYVPMTATNTAHLTISLADGTAVIYSNNGSDGLSTRVTYFSGRLVP